MLTLVLLAALAADPDVTVVVHEPEAPPGTETVDLDGFGTVGEALAGRAGVAMAVRGGNAGEPVIRGLGWERVATRVGGVPVAGACPGRMDPPVATLPAAALTSARLVRGLPSVTDGPVGTGGAVEVELTPRTLADGAWTGLVEGRTDGARAGVALQAAAEGTQGPLDLRVAMSTSTAGDYQTPSGIAVPASASGHHGTVAIAVRPREGLRWSAAASATEERDVDFPALPMDEALGRLILATSALELERGAGALRGLRVQGGATWNAHEMDNRLRPNRAMMAAETVSSARTWALSAEATLAPADAVGLVAGLDASRIARDATRTRDLASGASFTDRLWPAVSQLDLGAFAEGHVDLGGRTHLVAGGRGDLVRSAAAAADDPSLGGLTVREQYVRYYGEQAADTERDELVGGANLTVRQDLGEALFAALGLGAGARPANLTERAYAFSPAAAGFEVGDPSLRAERKLEAVLSVGATHERVALHAAAWAHRVDDLIRSAVVAQVDLDGDGALDAVRGFVPVDAALVGFELEATARLGGHWQIPVRLDATRGWERGTGAPLPEIPPLDATVGLRLDLGSAVPWFAEVNARGVAGQQRVAAAFPEDPTEAFWTLGASAGVSLDGRLDLVVRGRNLLDVEYDEHLTRAAIADLGGLVKGQDIAAPGRAVDLSLRARF